MVVVPFWWCLRHFRCSSAFCFSLQYILYYISSFTLIWRVKLLLWKRYELLRQYFYPNLQYISMNWCDSSWTNKDTAKKKTKWKESIAERKRRKKNAKRTAMNQLELAVRPDIYKVPNEILSTGARIKYIFSKLG